MFPNMLMFPDDEVAVRLDEITKISALGEQDVDVRSGVFHSPIPAGARTRIDTRSAGYFYVSPEFGDVMAALSEVEQ